jgi:uncharacterized protein with HEPN domain
MTKRPENDADRLGQILAAAQEARHVLEGHTKQTFAENRMLQLAVEKLAQNIGEAASHLSNQFKSEHDHIPWAKMIGMRHRLVHDFHAVDQDVVWDTVNDSIPPPIVELQQILETDTP